MSDRFSEVLRVLYLFNQMILSILVLFIAPTLAFSGTVQLPQTGETSYYEANGVVINVFLKKWRKAMKRWKLNSCRAIFSSTAIYFFYIFIMAIFTVSCIDSRKFYEDHTNRTLLNGCTTNPRIIDCENDKFHITSDSSSLGRSLNNTSPADVPTDSVIYALSQFGGLDKRNPFFNRIVLATKKAILENGNAHGMCKYNNINQWFAINFSEKEKNLVFFKYKPDSLVPDVFAVDLSNVDISVKPEEIQKEKISSQIQTQETVPVEKIKNSIGMEFVEIAPGTFMMGTRKKSSSYTLTQAVEFEYKQFFKTTKGFRRCMEGHEKCKMYEQPHRVNITNGFYLQSTEVTQEQWQEIMGFNPSYFKNCGKNCPIENISYNDIQEFIRLLNEREKTDKYRLPTEAEWEYAARGGGSGTYSFGEDEKLLQQYAWYSDNAQTKTNPVAQKKPNQWGLYDMHGNVLEWCEDWFDLYPEKELTDPQGPESVLNQWVAYSSPSFFGRNAFQLYPSRVTRGGSYEEGADGCYVSLRVPQAPDYKSYNLGFRLLKTK